MDMHDFVSGGGLITTTGGYDANVTQILVKSGNTYPLVGTVRLATNYYANVSWTANGTVINFSTTNANLNLEPIIINTTYSTGNNKTLSSYANVASWQAAYNQFPAGNRRNIKY